MNLIRAVVLILAASVVLGCSKDKIINPTGLYNVTTQVGSVSPKLGTMTINPYEGAYLLKFDMAAGGFGEIKSTITQGKIEFPNYKYHNTTYQGGGNVDEDGVLSLNFKIINPSGIYQVKVQGNRAK